MRAKCEHCRKRAEKRTVLITAPDGVTVLCGWVCAMRFTALRAVASDEPIPAVTP